VEESDLRKVYCTICNKRRAEDETQTFWFGQVGLKNGISPVMQLFFTTIQIRTI